METKKNTSIQFDEGGMPHTVQQNLVQPASYFGRSYIGINFGERASDYFKPECYHPSRIEQHNWSQKSISPSFISVLLEKARKPELKVSVSKQSVKNQTTLPPKPDESAEIDALTNIHKTDWWTVGVHNLSNRLQNIDLAELEAEAGKLGYKTIWYRNNAGALDFYIQNIENTNIEPRFYIIESYRLTSIPSRFGAGKIIKNLTLVPGEKTRLTISTYNHKKDNSIGSCILDSNNSESVQEFQNCIESETPLHQNFMDTIGFITSTETDQSCFLCNVDNEISLSFARKEFMKNFWKALTKHTTRAASKRFININSETTNDSLNERFITREFSNPNQGKTVNYIFRQLNQEFLTVLHLTDIRIGYSNGLVFKEFTLHELNSMLNEFTFSDMHDEIRSKIINFIMDIHNFENNTIRNSDIVQVMITTEDGINRNLYYFDHTYNSTFTDDSGIKIEIPGIIMSVNHFVLPTESTIIETLMGQTDMLDNHIREIQNEELRERVLNNDMKEREVEKITLAETIVKDTIPEKAKLFEEVFARFDNNNWT